MLFTGIHCQRALETALADAKEAAWTKEIPRGRVRDDLVDRYGFRIPVVHAEEGLTEYDEVRGSVRCTVTLPVHGDSEILLWSDDAGLEGLGWNLEPGTLEDELDAVVVKIIVSADNSRAEVEAWKQRTTDEINKRLDRFKIVVEQHNRALGFELDQIADTRDNAVARARALRTGRD